MAKRSLVSCLTLIALAMLSPTAHAQTEGPAASSEATPVPIPIFARCDVTPCVLSAGTWQLRGMYSFMQRLEVTLPDGWQSLESDAGEFNLFPLAHPDGHIFMVKDIAAITTDGTGELVPDVPSTADGLWAYWRDDPNVVVS